MKSLFSPFVLAIGISTLSAQTPAVPAAAAQAAKVPFSPQEQAFARTTSTHMQNLLQMTLAGRRIKEKDQDLSDYSTKLNRELVAQWTPFVNVCQAHNFHQIAIDVSKNNAEAIAKLGKLKGTEFRETYFKMTKPEAQRALTYVQSFLPQIRNAELKKSADTIATVLKTTSDSLNTKSAEPFTPQPAGKPAGKPGKPGAGKK